MKQNEKELLLKDLSARLPYHVKCKIWLNDGTTEEGLLDLEHNYGNVLQDAFYYNKIKDIKPYLFPLSSMTDEQEKEFSDLYYRYHESAFIFNERYSYDRYSIKDIGFYPYYLQDWLNANHFDYRGLIEKHLAIDATGLDVY